MNAVTAIVLALVGLAMSPVLVAVSVRSLDGRPLLAGDDWRRPFRLPSEIDRAELPSWKVPGTALAAAAGFALAGVSIGVVWVLPAYLWFLAMTLVLTLTDLDKFLIPNRVVYPATLIGAVLLSIGSLLDGDVDQLPRAFLGALAYFGAWLVIYWVSRLMFRRLAFGLGDVRLAVSLGLFLAYLGWPPLVIGALGSFVLGGAVSLLLMLFRICGRKDYIPFGPFMVAAAWISLFAHESITAWYNG